MGWSIWLQNRSSSDLRLARSLPFLAAFGMLHGFAEWGQVFIPIQTKFVPTSVVVILYTWYLLLFGISFLSLFLFGCHLIADTRYRFRALPALSILIFGLWALRFVLVRPATLNADLSLWVSQAEAWARYLLAVPGTLASAVGLHLQIRQFREEGFPQLVPDLKGMEIALLAYGFFSGVLVPKADFVPANTVHVGLLESIGVPVALPRALCSMTITFFLLRTLKVFEQEVRRRLEAAESGRVAAEERERLGRELHDGILQSIYAAGLGLEAIRERVTSNPTEVSHRIDVTLNRLNAVIAEIRHYISDLERPRCDEEVFRSRLSKIVIDFEQSYGVHVDAAFDGLPRDLGRYPVGQELLAMVKEALSNIGRHARASHVDLTVRGTEEMIHATISDNGVGFVVADALNRSGHLGLRNLIRRAALGNGDVRIESEVGIGTTIDINLPLVREERDHASSSADRG